MIKKLTNVTLDLAKITETTGIETSCLQVFNKVDVLKNFSIFAEIKSVPKSFFDKVTNLQPGILFEKRFRFRCFPVSFAIRKPLL